jgi:hypothetical protein
MRLWRDVRTTEIARKTAVRIFLRGNAQDRIEERM